MTELFLDQFITNFKKVRSLRDLIDLYKKGDIEAFLCLRAEI